MYHRSHGTECADTRCVGRWVHQFSQATPIYSRQQGHQIEDCVMRGLTLAQRQPWRCQICPGLTQRVCVNFGPWTGRLQLLPGTVPLAFPPLKRVLSTRVLCAAYRDVLHAEEWALL
jgi:hypothetical protein